MRTKHEAREKSDAHECTSSKNQHTHRNIVRKVQTMQPKCQGASKGASKGVTTLVKSQSSIDIDGFYIPSPKSVGARGWNPGAGKMQL